jgi:hypothetical protein
MRLLAYDANPVTLAAIAMPNLDFTLTGDYVELHNLLKIRQTDGCLRRSDRGWPGRAT